MHFGFGLTSFSLKNILLISMKKRHRRVFIIICFSQICCLFQSGIYMWRKTLLLKYIRLLIPHFFKYTFNFSQTVGEMVFVSSEVEKMRMFLVQSMVHWCWVLVRSWGAVVSFPVWRNWLKDRFQLAPVNWPSCIQQASLFMHGHGRAAFPIVLQIIFLIHILGHRCHIFQGIKDPPF